MQSQILPSRAALVDRIALQFEYGQNLITLLGPSGLGKSYLLETFITDKYNDFNKAFVQLHARMTDQQLMTELLEQSFSSPLIDHELSLSENFYRLAKEQACGACLWVLDGGRHLTQEMATELDSLAKKSPTTLYILLASQAVGQFNSAVEIHLEALSITESKQLMKWYFDNLPIDEDPIYQTFLAESHGNPSLLLAWQPTEHSAKVVHKQRIAWHVHLTALLFIIMLLIIGFLYKSDMTELWQDYYKTETNTPIATALPVEIVTQANNTQPDIQTETINSTENKQPELNSTESVSNTEEHSAIDDRPTYPSNNNNVAAILASLEVNNEVELPPKPTEIANSLELKVVNDIQQEPQLPVDNAWYLQQADKNWVIQLLAVTKLADSEQFISNNNSSQQVKTYQTKRGSRTWWIVTYGSYSSLSDAKAALATLPVKVRKNKPFYKQINKIKQEIALLDQ